MADKKIRENILDKENFKHQNTNPKQIPMIGIQNSKQIK
jgi:hypothetical protein